MAFCKHCGKENKKGKHCQFCGKKLIFNSFLKKYKILLLSLFTAVLILTILEVIALNTNIDDKSVWGSIKKGNYLLAGIEFCGNSKCIESELYSCNKDCSWCGDVICQQDEIGNCYEDCEWCGDGTCQEDEIRSCYKDCKWCGDKVCLENEIGNCLEDCVWCGDGSCQQDEIGSCYKDCEWCGDGYCQSSESCSSCSKDCGSCKSASYCGDGICNPGDCSLGCNQDCSYAECENGICEPAKGENCVTSPNDCRCSLNEKCSSQRKSCELITCGNGRCENSLGENAATCPNDCKEKYATVLLDPNIDLPIIFVHGHDPKEVKGYSPTELEEFQNKLEEEGYEDQGYVLPSTQKSTAGIWSGRKVSVIMTYYSNKYDQLGDIVGPDDNQHIKVYAERLRDVVEVVKHNTGKSKVIIIAHSMGGLVSRAYIKYYGGINSVNKLIMIGTPNHGTEGFIISDLCGELHPGPECEDMRAGSTFLADLNAGDETPGSIKYLTIIGRNEETSNCPDNGYWDNVICASSVYLEDADNQYYDDDAEGYSTTGTSLHTAMVKPSKIPSVYQKIVSFIKS